MSFALWRSRCSTCLRLGHRPYALAAFARQKSSPTHSAYASPVSLEISPEALPQSEEVQPTAVVGSSTIKRVGKLAKKSRGPKEEISSHRNLLEQTKVQEYLDFVASTNDSVTLADIERCRPLEHGVPGTQKYESHYNSLLDTLVRSFSTKQLRQFLHLYQLERPRKHTKWHYAACIIERQWGWPSLPEIQKQQRDWTEVTYRSGSFSVRSSMIMLTFCPRFSFRSQTSVSHPRKGFVHIHLKIPFSYSKSCRWRGPPFFIFKAQRTCLFFCEPSRIEGGRTARFTG
jgi:hypothetical protein